MRFTCLRGLLASILLATAVSPALAVQRTFVASTGLDTNPCNLASPCRSFARALTQTDVNGEVIVLDSAGYGAVTITQSVSIIAPEGIYAGISVFAGPPGIQVNPGAGGKVVLRGLSLNGQGGGPGIQIQSGDEVHLERCTVSNMTGDGIQVSGGTAVYVSDSVARSNSGHGILLLGGTPDVFVSDTRVSDNGGNGVNQQVGTLTLDRVRIQKNGNVGLRIITLGTTRTQVRSSQLSRNPGAVVITSSDGTSADVAIEGSAVFDNSSSGLSAQSSIAGAVTLSVTGSVVHRNSNIGISGDGAGTRVFVSGSTITQNNFGFSQSGTASFNTLGNNMRRANATETAGTITSIVLQ